MTTAWANLVRGKLIGALVANVGGTLMGAIALAAVPWLLASAWRGRWIGWTPNIGHIAYGAVGIFVVTLIDWLSRL